MEPLLTRILDYGGDILGYFFWIGGSLWFFKRALEIHHEVEKEQVDALRVSSWIGWLITWRKGVTKVSLGAIGVQVFALSWFTLMGMAIGHILNIWVYYIFRFSVCMMGIWSIVFSVRHLMWWWKHR